MELGDYTENRLNDETVSLSEKSEVKEKSGLKGIYFYSWLCTYCIDRELLTTCCFGKRFFKAQNTDWDILAHSVLV